MSMRLIILRTCRQTYSAANRVLWATDTFSFPDPIIFQRFIITRTMGQKRLLQGLRFKMRWAWQEETAWNKTLRLALVRPLIGLRILRLNILYEMEEKLWYSAEEWFLPHTIYTEGLRKLSTLPLENIDVTFRVTGHRGRKGLCQQQHMDEFAEHLKEFCSILKVRRSTQNINVSSKSRVDVAESEKSYGEAKEISCHNQKADSMFQYTCTQD